MRAYTYVKRFAFGYEMLNSRMAWVVQLRVLEVLPRTCIPQDLIN